MDAQLHRPTHDQYEENPHHHSVIHEGELDQHGEKKSVLKKVKDKAKKLKDTIKHHGHAHDQHQHDVVYDEDEDDDDEMVDDDPEVHGAPMYDTTVIKGTNLPMQVDVNLEKPTDPREDRYDGSHGYARSGANELERPQHVTAQPHLAQIRETVPLNIREPTGPIGAGLGHLQVDPDAPRSRHDHVPIPNYQSKVNDPTGQGAQEANVDPLIHKLENLDVGKSESKIGQEHRPYTGTHLDVRKSESKLGQEPRPYTGTHDQFTPETRSTVEQFKHSADIPSEHHNVEPKSVDPSYPDMSMAPQDTITGKITSATSAITEKAVSAKNAVASKLGYGSQEGVAASESSTKPVTETATEYAHAIADKLAPVYEKVAGAGTAVMAKVQGTTEGTGYDTGSAEQQTPDKGVSVKEYLAEKFRPGDEDKALSEVISDAIQMKKETAGEAQHHPVVGKVTESKEVRERLGTGKENKREGEDALASGNEVVGSGQGVVDKLKGAVTSWLGKSTGIETAQESVANSHVSGTGGTGSDERGGRR